MNRVPALAALVAVASSAFTGPALAAGFGLGGERAITIRSDGPAIPLGVPAAEPDAAANLWACYRGPRKPRPERTDWFFTPMPDRKLGATAAGYEIPRAGIGEGCQARPSPALSTAL